MSSPDIKINVVPKPIIKGKMDAHFPSRVDAEAPILLDKTGGNYSFSLDMNAINDMIGNSSQPLDSDLTAIAALTTTSYGRAFLALADASAARTAVGLGNVDNTSDANKPISDDTQAALDLKANTGDLASVATSGSYSDLTGKPYTVPVGGTTGQVLAKNSNTDGDTEWVNQTGGGGGGRVVLTANRTYYVRTDGSNSNNGLANTSGGAFLTIQKAIDVIAALDISVFSATIQVADGTYTTPVVLKSYVGAGPVAIVGNTTTPANVLISVTANDAITADTVVGKWQISGMKLTTITSGFVLHVANNSTVEFSKIDFGSAATGYYHMFTETGGGVLAIGDYSISGGALAHWFASDGGWITVRNRTITISGTPAFPIFAQVQRLSRVLVTGNTYSGPATGVRYTVSSGGVLTTNGATLPGDTVGVGTNFGVSPYGLYL